MILTAGMVSFVLSTRVECHLELIGDAKTPISSIRLKGIAPLANATLYIVEQDKSMHESGKTDRPMRTIEGVLESQDIPDDIAVLACPRESRQQVLLLALEIALELHEWDGCLQRSFEGDASLDEIISIGKRVIREPLALLSREFIVITCSQDYPIDPSDAEDEAGYQLPSQHVAMLAESPYYAETLKFTDPFYYHWEGTGRIDYVINMFQGTSYLSRFIARLPENVETLQDGETQLLEHFCRYLEQVYRQFSGNVVTIQSLNDAVHSFARAMIIENAQLPKADLSRALEQYGWEIGDTYTVIKLDFFEKGKWHDASLYLVHLLTHKWHDTCALAIGKSLVWIINETHRDCTLDTSSETPSSIPEDYILSLVKNHSCCAGISEMFEGFGRLGIYHREAEVALQLGRLQQPSFWYYRFSDYKLDYMLNTMISEFSIEQLCSDGVAKLLRYDKENGTELTSSLFQYLRNSRNVTRTADQLYLHRTSLVRRLDRIKTISGIDFENQDEMLHAYLSLQLLELTRR